MPLARKAYPQSGIGQPFGGGGGPAPDDRPPDFFLEFLGEMPPGMRMMNFGGKHKLMDQRGSEALSVAEAAERALARARQIGRAHAGLSRLLLTLVAEAAPDSIAAATAQNLLLPAAVGSPDALRPETNEEPDASDAVFTEDRVQAFEIELSDEPIAALRKDPKIYVRGTFRWGDQVLEDVGVRLKGFIGSFRRLDDQSKAGFSIKFNQFVKGQRLSGLKRLVLNNAAQDASYLHEYVGYGLYRAAGVPAPRVAHANIRPCSRL